MRIKVCAVGRLRKGPELELVDDYLDRFAKLGRSMGFDAVQVIEVEDRKGGGMKTESALLEKVIPNGALICTLDERGRVMSSPDFAEKLSTWRDQGVSDIAFVIGGADGIHPDLRARAQASLSFGKMVWPHMLVRVMLSEQLYRAASILAGSPYHRA